MRARLHDRLKRVDRHDEDPEARGRHRRRRRLDRNGQLLSDGELVQELQRASVGGGVAEAREGALRRGVRVSEEAEGHKGGHKGCSSLKAVGAVSSCQAARRIAGRLWNQGVARR